ncbi:MAG: FMN-binding protein [Clostridia bacterium]|nr:FMN-binding protein [Clostridia bacterium]
MFACSDKPLEERDIVAAVDSPEGYSAVDISAFESNIGAKSEIKKVFRNQDKTVIYTVTQGGYNGEVELVVLLEGVEISDIKALNIKETENIGTKAFNEAYLSQFTDIDVSEGVTLAGASRPSEGIDIIYVTGATYTSNAVINAINAIIVWYGKNSQALQTV